MTATLTLDLTTALAAGLLSSLHCVGMCGPLATLGCRAARVKSTLLAPLLFAGGKFVAYSVLGIFAGLVGAAFIGRGTEAKTTAVVSIVGAVLILAVVALSHFHKLTASGPLQRVSLAISKLAMRAGWNAPLLLGSAAALLPCGLLYAMVARSAAAADPLSSMMIMQAFGLGTTPALVGLGTLLSNLPRRFAKYGSAAGEAVLVISAMVLLWRGYVGFAVEPIAACCGGK